MNSSTDLSLPTGFRGIVANIGVKDSTDDLVIVATDGPVAASGVFTQSRFVGPSVLVSREHITNLQASAVVVISKNANVANGQQGEDDAREVVALTARHVGCEPGDVLIASTGVIGRPYPMETIRAGFADISDQSWSAQLGDIARGIMTTDTVPKAAVREGDGYVVGGMAKGAGMLAPGLATMLVFITTDADVPAAALDAALRHATSVSFDRIDSDGCMSTNDAVIVMASGSAQTAPDIDEFTTVLTDLCVDLAQQLIADAEGASKDIAITVHEAASESDALEAARNIARSNLLKCAIHGEDPNWGRVLSALGTTAAAFESDHVDVAINGVTVCRGGGVGDPREGVDMSQRDVVIDVHLKAGPSTVTVWTNDLTADYVHENSAYST